MPLVSLVTMVRQVLFAVGRIQASSVIPVVRSSDALSAMVTMSLTPSKASAPPDLPAPVQAAPEIVPVVPLPELSGRLVPVAASKE